jgi:hypothetical protein
VKGRGGSISATSITITVISISYNILTQSNCIIMQLLQNISQNKSL